MKKGTAVRMRNGLPDSTMHSRSWPSLRVEKVINHAWTIRIGGAIVSGIALLAIAKLIG